MSIRKKPSYFDDDYDERMQKRKRFTFKAFLQVLAYFLIVAFKALRDFVVNFRAKHPLDEIVRNNRKRHRLTFVLIIVSIMIFSVMIGAVMLAVNNENKKIAQFNADAGAVCSSFIKEYGTPNYENMYYSYGVVGYRMTGLCYVREMDFNNDGTSELLVCFNDNGVYQAEVWGYNGREFNQLYHCKAAQTKKKSDDAWVTIYRHNNKYYLGVHSKNLKEVSLFGMRGDEFTKRYDATYDKKSELFSVRDEVDYSSFERIKLSVLREEKAAVVLDTVSDTIDGFKTDSSTPVNDKVGASREQAYADVVRELQEEHGSPALKTEDGVSFINGLAYVNQIDFDGDGKKELIVAYRDESLVRDEDYNGDYISITTYRYATKVYKYQGKRAKLVYEREDVCQKADDNPDKCMIIQNIDGKHNLCFNNYSKKENGHVVTASSTILEFNGTDFEPTFKSKFVTDYGYKEHYINDKWVNQAKFEEEGCIVPFFDGSGVYSSTEFSVAYLQREAGNSGSVQTQLNETKSAINKLVK